MQQDVNYYSDFYLPLTEQQKGMWNIETVHPNTAIGIVSGSVESAVPIDFVLFEKAINYCIQSNDAFQIRITLKDNKHVQYLDEYKYIEIDTHDFNNVSELYSWKTGLINTPMSLLDSRLYSFSMFRVKNGQSGYFIKTHHTISDAWTMAIMTSQIIENYNNLKAGLDIEVIKKPSYVDYIQSEQEYFSSKSFLSNKQFWDEKLSLYPEFYSIKPYAETKSVLAKRKTFIIHKDIAEQINEFCRRNETTVFTFFMSILTLYINKLTSKKDIVLGSPILNRKPKDRQTMGMFINIIPLRFVIDTKVDFITFVRNIGREILHYLRNQKYPYDMLLTDYKKKHGLDKIYDIMFSYQNSKLNEDILTSEYKYFWEFNGYQTESLCIHIDDRDRTGEFVANFDYLTDAFDEIEIVRMHDFMLNIIKSAINNPETKVAYLSMVSNQEINLLLNSFNSKKHEYPKNLVFHQIFEQNVKKHPQKVAVVCDGKSITYDVLNSKANQLARLLRHKGVAPDTVVGIMTTRSIEAIIGFFAILKSGAAFLPLSFESPTERLQTIISESKLSILLTNCQTHEKRFNCETINLCDTDSYLWNDRDLDNISSPSDLMYIIYTSGSTGIPKGVMIEHKSFMNTAYAWKSEYQLDQFDVVLLQLANFTFDVFCGDLARAFLCGGTMVIALDDEKFNFHKLCYLMCTYGVSIFESTPQLILPLMDFMYKHKLDIYSLKLLILGSDTCMNLDFRRLMHRFGDKMRIVNSYGVTEATIDSSYYEEQIYNIPEKGCTSIGKPLGNVKFYILGEDFDLKPIGTTGELYIGGDSVARGYFGNEQLTNERFFNSPFVLGERIYKTGDLAKWDDNGNVIFCGRDDVQVKVKGFRIDLKEIENKILQMGKIKEAVVVAKDDSLYAFVILSGDIDPGKIKRHLHSSLPHYMVPSGIFAIDKLELSSNGKVDKKAIFNKWYKPASDTVYVAPKNETERILCEVWQTALEIEQVGVQDNFFEIGGDSLAIIQILSSTYNNNWKLSIQDFYRYHTIKELAGFISGEYSTEQAVENDQYKHVTICKHADKLSVTVDDFEFSNVLLTGATGFLGIHLLDELLTNTNANVHCLVRNNKERLLELLQHYFNKDYSYLLNKRLFVAVGDVAEKQFGLSDEEYAELSNRVDAVIHSAAIVSHYGNESEFERTNVDGTKEVIGFCEKNNKRCAFISTTSVSGDTLHQECEVFLSENDFYVGQNYSDNVYIKSKFKAEFLALTAIDGGLDGTIIRVGNLTGRYRDGVFQKNVNSNMFYSMIKSIVSIKAVPNELLQLDIELTPVDLCSKAICEIIKIKESKRRVFHIFNHKTVKIEEFVKMLNNMGYSINSLEPSLFTEHVQKLNKEGCAKESALFFVNDYNFEKFTDKSYKAHISSEITDCYLNALNFKWPSIDGAYIHKVVKHMEDLGYLGA